ncbi:hypothetical protein NMG60_11014560 [Bertholletia excelsa]
MTSLSIPPLPPPPPISSILNPNPKHCHALHFNTSSRSVASPLFCSNFANPFQKFHPRTTRIRRISAAAEDALPPDANPVENSQQIVSGGDDDGSIVISVLLFVAFIGLSILTIGVIYIAVTDFLQKREREKFEKEEAPKKKKGGRNVKSRARAGPRGFGQKIEEDDE